MRQELYEYFTNGIERHSEQTIGTEIETSFMNGGEPISLEVSQQIFVEMHARGWEILTMRNGLLTSLRNHRGDRLLYELGRQNLELAIAPGKRNTILLYTELALNELYTAARKFEAKPLFEPRIHTNVDLLIIPDKRDADWLKIDGRRALAPLATISSFQCTIEIEREKAVLYLNRLNCALSAFREMAYPQDEVWKTYIRESKAGYDPLRYGGPLHFDSLYDYCEQLSLHKPVGLTGLIDPPIIEDVTSFVRSVWWYFRLRRYNNKLCIEIRPYPRGADYSHKHYLDMALNIMNGTAR